MARPKTEHVAFQLRVPPDLHRQLEAALHQQIEAATGGTARSGETRSIRSMNGEIVHRLRRTFDPRIADYMAKIEVLIEEERRAREYIDAIRDPALKQRITAQIDAYMKDIERGLADHTDILPTKVSDRPGEWPLTYRADEDVGAESPNSAIAEPLLSSSK
jgi:hypothetical protein